MEQLAKHITLYVSHTAEMIAAVIIGISVIKIIMAYCIFLFRNSPDHSTEEIRVRFGSSVAVGLELLLGADVLSTAVAPSWNDIGQLAAIATIRTILNYFLERELKQVA